VACLSDPRLHGTPAQAGGGDSKIPLQIIGAGPAGMGLGLNILPEGEPRGEQSLNGGIHGFQSYPLAIAPRIIDSFLANMPMGG
jgi:hypothetical protein